MTEEFAGMPQAILRELVLRLVGPETAPPITASSVVSLREQQATASLKPASALRLSRSPEALDYLLRYNAHAPLLDEITGLFLAVAEEASAFGDLLSKHTLPGLVFEEISYAYRVAILGASRPTMERTMVQLVRIGWWSRAEKLAHLLQRNLTGDEVLDMVKTYTEGAVQSSSDDEMWPEFAGRHLGTDGDKLARRWIVERDARWANDPY